MSRRARGHEGALSPGFLMFMVAALAGIFLFVQVGHASVLSTEARTASDAASLGAAAGIRDALDPHTPPSALRGIGCAAAEGWASRNGASVQDCTVTVQLERLQIAIETTVRGNRGTIEGPSDTIPQGRPVSTSRAEMRLAWDEFRLIVVDIRLAPVGGSDDWHSAPTVPMPGGPIDGPAPPSADGFAWPVCGPVTSEFGPRRSPGGIGSTNHSGIDQGDPTGTPAFASRDGRVSFAGWAGGYGNAVYVEHSGGFQTRYAHMSALTVSTGDQVSQGDRVGLVGSTGNSTGPHMHFEIRHGGRAYNPRNYLGSGAPCS